MIPALFMRMSSRSVVAFTILAASLTDSREAKSKGRMVMLAFGTTALIVLIEACAFSVDRDARKILLGLCLAS